MAYIPKIGLEIHAHLNTATKMFCGSPNNPDEKNPNVNVCPICAGYPGVLPVINKEAVKSVLRAGLAIGGQLADYTQFDRKNYFYPDLPKGYQISQYKFPLVSGGTLNNVKITRIHLEEDAGKLVHNGEDSLVDLNRAGTPLMELVTEPDIKSAGEARVFAEELRLLLRYLNISNADMEKGQMRVEANVSVAPKGSTGTKVEVKNLNSFRAVEQAINYEIKRQIEALDKGEKIIQETRGWDDVKGKTFAQRSKEEAHDYRYFPEPDLPPLKISDLSAQAGMEDFNNLETTIPELPWQKRERFKNEYKVKENIVNNFINDQKLADFFENTISEARADDSKISKEKFTELAINYITSDLAGLMKESGDIPVDSENFADLIIMVAEEKISSRVAKDVLKEMVKTGVDPREIVKEKGLEQKTDESFVENLAKIAIEQNPKAVKDFKEGKENSIQFLVGQVMKETRGAVSPQKAREILENLLK